MPLQNVSTGNSPDRRRHPRLRLAYRLRLTRHGEAILETKTEDISCKGFLCITERELAVGEILECELDIASQELGKETEHHMVLCCRAEVVRVVPQANKTTFGVACRLRDYTVGSQTIERDSMGVAGRVFLKPTTPG